MICGCSITAFGLFASVLSLVRSKDPGAIYGIMRILVWECSFAPLPEVVFQQSPLSIYQHLKYSLRDESDQVVLQALVFFTSVLCVPVAKNTMYP